MTIIWIILILRDRERFCLRGLKRIRLIAVSRTKTREPFTKTYWWWCIIWVWFNGIPRNIYILFWIPGFLLYVSYIVIAGLATIFIIAPRCGNRNPLVYVYISGSIGSLSVMACKGIGLGIKVQFCLSHLFRILPFKRDIFRSTTCFEWLSSWQSTWADINLIAIFSGNIWLNNRHE